MLLAADYTKEDGSEGVELLTAPWAAAGTPVILEGADPAFQKPAKIDIDKFCECYYEIKDHTAQIAGVNLTTATSFSTSINKLFIKHPPKLMIHN